MCGQREASDTHLDLNSGPIILFGFAIQNERFPYESVMVKLFYQKPFDVFRDLHFEIHNYLTKKKLTSFLIETKSIQSSSTHFIDLKGI